ncbi:MAG TPA: hypothetical protein VFO69_08025 [Allosphingosinicella sp.]|nr:hypothetical protein [Allosphingosinicella sp.]
MAFEYRVSIQFRHPNMDPDDIARHLDRQPVRSWRAGEPRTRPKGQPLGGNYRETYCAFDVGRGEDGELASCLLDAVTEFEAAKAFFQQIRATGGRINFYVTWRPGNRGEVFDIGLMSRMAEVGIDLGIEPLN